MRKPEVEAIEDIPPWIDDNETKFWEENRDQGPGPGRNLGFRQPRSKWYGK